MAFVTRFAPSPTGYLHLGHAYSAMLIHDMARKAGGTLRLRIEDIDTTRVRPEFEEAIFEDLRWLGVRWDGPVLRQSERLDRYEAALSRLIEEGLAYRCFRTRKEIEAITSAPHSTPAPFKGVRLSAAQEKARLEAADPFSWRLDMAAARECLGSAWEDLSWHSFGTDDDRYLPAMPELFGDVILARKDIGTSYHIASVTDDAAQGITHIIRGEDLRDAVGLHRLLQSLLDLPEPCYHHHRLITDDAGKRLAKRDRSITIRAMREAGETAQSLRERLGLQASPTAARLTPRRSPSR